MSGFDILGPAGPTDSIGVRKPYGGDSVLGDGARVDGSQTEQGEEFLSHLNEALMGVRELQVDTRNQARGLAAGEPVEVHDLMVAMGKSEVAFNMMLEVRNKLLEAWSTLRRSVT